MNEIEFTDDNENKYQVTLEELIDVTQAIFKSPDTYLKRCSECKKLLIWIHGYCDDVCKGISGLEEYNFSECWECKGVFCNKCSYYRDLRECNSTDCNHNLQNTEGNCYLFACKICRDIQN